MFALADATEIALIRFDLAKRKGSFFSKMPSNTSRSLWKYSVTVDRFKLNNSAAVRAGTPATNWTIRAL